MKSCKFHAFRPPSDRVGSVVFIIISDTTVDLFLIFPALTTGRERQATIAQENNKADR
jgi:hypothetical protein